MEKIVIIGGGLSGLAAAYFLHKKAQVTLIEGSCRLGGWIQSIEKDGFLFECGPRGFRPKGRGLFTYELALNLGLQPMGSDKLSAKRFLLDGQRLQPISLSFALKKGLLRGLWKDWFCKPSHASDETVEQFFSRHIGSSLTDSFINPLMRGIFAGDYRTLSAKSCFPDLWEKDQKVGSLLRCRSNTRSKLPPLMSFKRGMEELIVALASPLEHVILNTPVRSICNHQVITDEQAIDADKIILALPARLWAPWFGLTDPHPYASLTTVSLGWHKAQLTKRGYGFLVPGQTPLMGMTFDSCIFPDQAGGTRVCAMIQHEQDPHRLLDIASSAAKNLLGITSAPDSYHLHKALQCIPQYAVGHSQWVFQITQKLPPSVLAIGNTLYGVAVNDCLYQTHHLLKERNWI